MTFAEFMAYLKWLVATTGAVDWTWDQTYQCWFKEQV